MSRHRDQEKCHDIVEEYISEVEKHEITPQRILYLCSRIQIAEAENQRKDERINVLKARINAIQQVIIRIHGLLNRIAPTQIETTMLKSILTNSQKTLIG